MPRKQLNDEMLVAAMRQRLLDEIQKRQEHQAIINNVYGGGSHEKPASMGVADQLGSAGDGEDPYDYFVDITRKDLPEINPQTGKPMGWEKSVHRHRQKKKIEPLRPKGQ